MSLDKRHLLKSAYNYTQAGQWDRALEEYRKTARLFPDDPNIHTMISDLLAKKGDAPGGARSQIEAARLFKALGADDKELLSLRKALRMQAGNAEAGEALRANLARSLVQAHQALVAGRLDEASAVAKRLLDADPGSLDANRLMDDIKAARLASDSARALQEEADAAPADATDAAADVLARLEGAVQAYLQAEDYDNAIETLLVMLKLDPARASVQALLAEARSKVAAMQAAQNKWQEVEAQKELPLARARAEVKEADLAAWRDEEEAVRLRLEDEQRQAEAAARYELEIIEKAVHELRAAHNTLDSVLSDARKSAVAPEPRTPAPAAAPEPSTDPAPLAQEDPRLKSLLAEREALIVRLREEQALTARQEQSAEVARANEAEVIRHAVAMAAQEAEAKAKAQALRELEARLGEERDAQRREIEAERKRMQEKENSLQAQMRELMRTEMERLHAEVREQTLKELNERLQAERQQRSQLESEASRLEREAEARARVRMDQAEREQRAAEEAARKEREAVELLKGQEETRRRAFSGRGRAQARGPPKRRRRQGRRAQEFQAHLRCAARRHHPPPG